jgi:hypothetical protein
MPTSVFCPQSPNSTDYCVEPPVPSEEHPSWPLLLPVQFSFSMVGLLAPMKWNPNFQWTPYLSPQETMVASREISRTLQRPASLQWDVALQLTLLRRCHWGHGAVAHTLTSGQHRPKSLRPACAASRVRHWEAGGLTWFPSPWYTEGLRITWSRTAEMLLSSNFMGWYIALEKATKEWS